MKKLDNMMKKKAPSIVSNENKLADIESIRWYVIYTYIYIYMYLYMYMYIYICMYICMRIYVYV
jgi:hypothetical protein